MKKIMFNDCFGLTQSVLDGRKTMTRRVVSEKLWDKWTEYDDFCGSVACGDIPTTRQYYHEKDFFLDNSPFKVGEIVAIAQSYASIVDELEDPKNFYCMEHWESASPKRAHYCGFLYHPGMTNKMFVSADEMPHQIRITNIRVERLQNISDEDCVKEGVYMDEDPMNPQAFIYTFPNASQWYFTPREAFAALIDKVSGKGTWESNPFVFAYSFELVKQLP